MIESERLSYIRHNQPKLRVEKLSDLADAALRGRTDPSSSGKRFMPTSFTGGPRYMIQNFQDAMAICKWCSYPDLFITFTCNPKWPELTRFFNNKGLKSEDRPDILYRMFKMKLDALIHDFKQNELFGRVDALIYTVEFQKRGLPHAHIVLFLHHDNKIPTPEGVDQIIFAEIPDKAGQTNLHDLEKEYMMHGPCGIANRNSPCMVNNKCSKQFPKLYNDHTYVDDEGFPVYRRRNNGRTVEKGDFQLDNSFVVPYNPTLLCRYQAHINVEWCNKHRSIKYLFKYINKGPDKITTNVCHNKDDQISQKDKDEIRNYITCRYVSPCEAVWRTMGFDIHYRFPPVQRLTFHLENEQGVIFGDDDYIDDVLARPTAQQSMFLAWMECNKNSAKARKLTYVEFPSEFVWDNTKRVWLPRQSKPSLGRLQYVPLGSGEQYYLGLLIPHTRAATCHKDIRTINHVVYPTFKEACYSMGLLDDDREYIDGIIEASFWGSAHYIRNLFAILLMSSCMTSPNVVFEKTWECLSDDILHRHRRILNFPDLHLTDDELKNYALLEIENLLHQNGTTLKRFDSMPFPDHSMSSEGYNKLIQEELRYDRQTLQTDLHTLSTKLTVEQKSVFDQIVDAGWTDNGGFFFVYGYGGTGKTFIWTVLSAAVRLHGHIVLNVASSGIASLLPPGGRTAHSRFAIPINLNEASTCHIKPGTELSALILKAKLIIWDEAPMMSRFCFEALDRSLKDIIRTADGSPNTLPFGGKTVVFGGDFRQILPVIPKGSREDVVHKTINSSYLWDFCKVLKLTKNMRLENDSVQTHTTTNELAEFSDWILKVGDGDVGDADDGFSEIQIPEENLITDDDDPVDAIIRNIYPCITDHFCTNGYFEDKAILAPTHKVVESVNDRVLSLIPGEKHEYLSSDSVCTSENQSGNNVELYSVDHLNSIKCSGLPNHRLLLKIGVHIMLLRNIDQKVGLCNGTRLVITKLGKHILEAKIISGRNVGDRVYIPRMTLSNSDETSAVRFQRRQFPIILCFSMMINKSQGQSLSTVGLYLPRPVFTHGQLYVAISRVRTKKGLKILCLNDEGKPCKHTTNVVYKEVFRNL